MDDMFWTFQTDAVDVTGVTNLRASLSLEISCGSYGSGSWSNAIAYCTLDDDTVKEVWIYAKNQNVIRDLACEGPVVESASLPSNTVSLYLKVYGPLDMREKHLTIDNILLTGTPPPSEFDNWIQTALSSSEIEAYQTNPLIDVDGDGMELIKEFYFGKNHTEADASSVVELSVSEPDDGMILKYQRRKGHQGVTVAYERSNNLKDWHPVPNPSESTTDNSIDMENVEVNLPITDEIGFIRIKLRED